MILAILLLFITIEVIIAASEIKSGVWVKAQYGLRILAGIIINIRALFIFQEFTDFLVLNSFAFGFYWTMFSGFLNFVRGRNWFEPGRTKKWSLFWTQHLALYVLSHFIRWSLILTGFTYWLHVYRFM